MNPRVTVGLFAGVVLTFVFWTLTMKVVGRAASSMVEEVRRQFRENLGIMQGTAEPDYASCVGINTRAAQCKMVILTIIGFAIPLGAGTILGVPGVIRRARGCHDDGDRCRRRDGRSLPGHRRPPPQHSHQTDEHGLGRVLRVSLFKMH